MKRFAFFILLPVLFAACSDTGDKVVAEVYENKLFLSEVVSQVPDYLTGKDSADYAKKIIEDWTIDQLLLHEANLELSPAERNFTKELAELRKDLMIQAYCRKITADTTLFPVSDEEIAEFMRTYGMNYSVEKEIVRLNYVKLSKKSKLIPKVKAILSDDDLRQTQKDVIEKLCSDSIEYFIDDDKWLYLEDIEVEFPLQLKEKERLQDENRFIEVDDDEYHYMIVLLDYRKHQTAEESGANKYDHVRDMIRQQKRVQFIKEKIDALR